jgi:TPR repeat protein
MTRQPVYPYAAQQLSPEAWQARLAEGPEAAARWIYAAAMSGSTVAHVTWGQMLLDGTGMRRDPEAALRWFRIAADAGSLDGINMVGRCHERGWGVARDPAEAARWFRRAADGGHDWAQYNLGLLLVDGDGVPCDRREALSLFVRAARKRNPKGMNMIGHYREHGWIVRADLRSAARWYRRAAAGGCFRGAFSTGRFAVSAGRIEDAARWFETAVAEAPVDYCRDAAAVLLAQPEPEIRAVGRLALARCAQADAPADLFAYGRALAQGQGGPVDLEAAAAVLARADARGFPGAAAMLGDVLRRMPQR